MAAFLRSFSPGSVTVPGMLDWGGMANKGGVSIKKKSPFLNYTYDGWFHPISKKSPFFGTLLTTGPAVGRGWHKQREERDRVKVESMVHPNDFS